MPSSLRARQRPCRRLSQCLPLMLQTAPAGRHLRPPEPYSLLPVCAALHSLVSHPVSPACRQGFLTSQPCHSFFCNVLDGCVRQIKALKPSAADKWRYPRRYQSLAMLPWTLLHALNLLREHVPGDGSPFPLVIPLQIFLKDLHS